MQSSTKLPESQTPFVGIQHGDYRFVPPVKSDVTERRHAEDLYNALNAEVLRIKLLVGEAVLNTRKLANMQPLVDENRTTIANMEAIAEHLNKQYNFIPF